MAETEQLLDHILVVDDEIAPRTLMRGMLEEASYRVTEAEGGPQAIEAALRDRPHVVVVDLAMPGMNGDEVCRRLKSSPETGRIPVIIVTGMTEPESRTLSLASGADEFLRKPFSDVELLTRVRAVLRTRHLVEQVSQLQAREIKVAEDPSIHRNDPPCVLVVDDEEDVRKTARAVMEGMGAQVFCATSLAEARTLLDPSLDVVLLDLMLGDGGGLDLLREIRADARLSAVSVVILTTLDQSQDRVRGLEAGADDYLTKPTTPLELQARVRRQVVNKRFREGLLAQVAEASSQASTDALTQLYNRRHLDEALTKLIASSLRQGQDLCVLMADVDLFKAVNDRYGHAAGDDVLRAVAAALRSKLRGMDWVARYGGEEFAVILPMTEVETGACVADRVRERVAAMAIAVPGLTEELHVTMSIGVAALGRERLGAAELLERADKALYAAKHGGRNRVCVHGR